jgi:hypothetical protein
MSDLDKKESLEENNKKKKEMDLTSKFISKFTKDNLD